MSSTRPSTRPDHQTGDQVYRRVSVPTLPVPPATRSSLSRSVARPRGPRNDGNQRVPGEWPSQNQQPTWGPQGSSGLAWGYGVETSRSGSRDSGVSRTTAPVILGPPVSTPSSSSRYRRTGNQHSTPPTNIPSYLTTSQYTAPPSSFLSSISPDIGQTQEPEEYISGFMGRSRSSSVTNTLTDLAGRLRRPSLNLGAAVGAVGDTAPIRWVAEMVGYAPAGSGTDEVVSRQQESGGDGR